MGNMMRVPSVAGPIYDASFIPNVSRSTAPILTWEPRPQSRLTRETRQRIADLVETLISLLDLSEPDNEDVPVFPGHPAYRLPSEAWVSSRDCQLSGMEVDREADYCDDEPDHDGEADADREPSPGARPPASRIVGTQMIWETSTIAFRVPVAEPAPLRVLIGRAGK